jgi:CheY-like chemotaxis protein
MKNVIFSGIRMKLLDGMRPLIIIICCSFFLSSVTFAALTWVWILPLSLFAANSWSLAVGLLAFTAFYKLYLRRMKNKHAPLSRAQDQRELANIVDTYSELPNILIVDDHPGNIMLMHKYTCTLKCKSIDNASGGRQAIEKHKKNKYDLIFMDCQMPDIDGFTACKVIRRLEKEKSLTPAVIIGVTADMTRIARKKCLESGMNDTVYKPTTREILTATIAPHMPNAIDYEKISNIQSEENLETKASNPRNTALKSAQPPVNLSHIHSYADGDQEEENMLFSLFIDQAKNSVQSLKENLEIQNHAGWCHAAHKLKGASANLGAEQLAELCQMAEHHDSGLADEDLLHAIQAEFEKVDSFLNHLIEEDKYSKNNQMHQ